MDWLILGLYSVWFSACMLYSILAPFFPSEAEAHGMSPNTLGIMFSLYAWAGFCFSPFLGKLSQAFGRKKIYLLGVCSETLGIFIFVLVIHTDGVMFILISFIGRILMGLGGSSILISTFAMIASLYHDSMEAKIGISESLGGIGLIIGPLVGGLIYAIAGYSGVFLTILVVFMVAGFSTYRLIPDYVADVEKVEKEKFSLSTLAFHKVNCYAECAAGPDCGSIWHGGASLLRASSRSSPFRGRVRLCTRFIRICASYARLHHRSARSNTPPP